MNNTTLNWSGTFANDKNNAENVYAEMERIVGEIETLFAEAKTYWVDDNDPKGVQFKTQCENSFTDLKNAIVTAKGKKDELFSELDAAMKNING